MEILLKLKLQQGWSPVKTNQELKKMISMLIIDRDKNINKKSSTIIPFNYFEYLISLL